VYQASEEGASMSSLVIERARQLAQALENSDEYTAYKKALEELERHEAARLMWNDFQKRQAAIQKARLSGETVTEEQVRDLERGFDLLLMNPYVRDVIVAEVKFTQLFAEVQRIIGEAVGIQYSASEDLQEAEESNKARSGREDGGSKPGSSSQDDVDLQGPRRILVPGRDF